LDSGLRIFRDPYVRHGCLAIARGRGQSTPRDDRVSLLNRAPPHRDGLPGGTSRVS
jgi:hypothetical protein